MPVYTYACSCGHADEQFNRVDDRHTHAPEHCGERMSIRLSAPMISVQAEARFASSIDGSIITTRRARSEHMKRHGVVEALPASETIAAEDKKWQRNRALADELPKLPEPIQRRLMDEAMPF